MHKRINRGVSIAISDEIIKGVSDEVVNIAGGMRYVDRIMGKVIWGPLGSILVDILEDSPIVSIEAKLEGEKIHWRVNGEEVFLEGTAFGASRQEERHWVFAKDRNKNGHDRTPSLGDIKRSVIELSEEEKRNVATHEVKGHWQVDTLFNKKNTAAYIGVISEAGRKGFVRYRMPELNGLSTLTTI